MKNPTTKRLVLSICLSLVLIIISILMLLITGNMFGCGGIGNCKLEMQLIIGFPVFLGILAFPFGTIFLILLVYLFLGIWEEVKIRIERRRA